MAPLAWEELSFESLKGKSSYRVAGSREFDVQSTAWVWRFQDESGS